MSGVATPVKMVEAFGINAGPAYITAPFPVASQISIAPGNASLNDGFTPLNMTPITDGGIPPSGADMNGILFLISSMVAAVCAGQLYNAFDSTYATAIGGYKIGAIVADATTPGRTWRSLIDGNTTDPATTPANWVSSTPILSTSAPTAGTHADNVLAGPSDFFLDVNTAAGAITLNGFVPQRDGQRLIISCVGANPLTIGALAGTAANQVRMSSAITLLQNDSITTQYCLALTKWVQV
jgi:hypothetical protein